MGAWQDFTTWLGMGRVSAAPVPMSVRATEEPPPIGKPIILISAQSATSASLAATKKMIEAQGGQPLEVSDHIGKDAAKDLAKVAAVVVIGNDSDIDASTYGQANDPQTKSELDPTRDPANAAQRAARATYENDAIRLALSNRIPLLGICGGMQRMNLIHNKPPNGIKGTLFQRLDTVIGAQAAEMHDQRNAGIAAGVPVEDVHLTGGLMQGISQGANLLWAPAPGAGQPAEPNDFMENSFHHQNVDKVGLGFVSAAEYGQSFIDQRTGQTRRLTAAIEPDPNGPYANQFALGVQWHPEFGASSFGPKLFSAFVGAARERQMQTEQNVATLESAFGSPSEHVQSILANGPKSFMPSLRPPMPSTVSRLAGPTQQPTFIQR